MSAPRGWLATGLLLAAGVAFGQAQWIEAKASVAQWLLDRAWERNQAGEAGARPWPWADTSPIAELTVPRLDERLLVLAGASGRTLAFGPGHVSGSSLPGEVGNAVLTGHRDTHFRFLRDLGAGDLIEVRDLEGASYRYRVRSLAVEHMDSLQLDPVARRPELTLVTCYPFDALTTGGPLRYIVRASLVAPLVESAA